MHRDFHLQTTIVSGDHLIGEACGNHQVRLGETLGQQPARAHLAAKFLVVGEVQLHATLEWQAK